MFDCELKKLEVEFGIYMKQFVPFVNKKTESYNDFFRDGADSSFFRTIFYTLKEFLNDDKLNKLFITLPIQELGYKKKDIPKNWDTFQKTIADVLCLATNARQREMVVAPELDKSKENDVYFCLSEQDPIFLKIAKSKQTSYGLRPKLVWAGRRTFRTPEAVSIYNDNRSRIFKTKIQVSEKDENGNIDSRKLANITSICNLLQKYNGAEPFSKQYESALIVGFNDNLSSSECIYKQDYFDTPLSFESSVPDTLNYDVVCIIGDVKYSKTWDKIQNSLAKGDIKKVIFIGTSLDEFREGENSVKFDFSIRELYHYFAKSKFPQIKLDVLKFDWLEKQIEELNDIIGELDGVTPEQKQQIINYTLYPFLGMQKRVISEDDVDNYWSFLHDNFSLSGEIEERLENYYKECNFDEKNPKKIAYANAILGQVKKTHLIDNPYSYKRKVDSFIGKNNNQGNVVFVDIKGNSSKYIDVLKYLTKYYLLGTIHFLSYTNHKQLEKIILQEPYLCCNGNYRNQLFQLKLNEITYTDNVEKSSLSDYFTMIDDYLYNDYRLGIEQVKYTLDFDDTEKADLTGDILCKEECISLSDLPMEKLPIEVTYYVAPSDFDAFIRIIHNFSKEQNVMYYVRLWKEKLSEYYREKCGGKLKGLHERFPFLSRTQMRKYIDPDSDINFPHKFALLVREMRAMELITEEERKFLLGAQAADKERKEQGRNLKAALYDYKLKGVKNKYLEDFDRKAASRGENMNSDMLLNECLKTKTLVAIKKIKR